MQTRRTSKEEEDDNNKEEEDCAAGTAAATASAAATPAATAGLHASSAASVSDHAVAAVAASWRRGLQRGTVAAAADSRMPLFTSAFFVFLTKCLLHVAQNTMFHGSFPPTFRPEFRIPEDSRTN